MSITRYRGLLVVVLWQTVPNPVAVDSTGRIQGVLGFGAGEYEVVRTDCNSGEQLDTGKSKFEGGGVQIDAWPSRNFRVTGFGGSIRSDSARFDGPYYGALVALELQDIGAGLGGALGPEDRGMPAIYIRVGNRDALHARFDMAPPNPPFGASGAARGGLGYHLGHLRGLGGFGGLAFCHAPCDGNSRAALFAEVRIPIGSTFDLELRGLGGKGQDHSNTGLAVAGRLHLVR